MFLFGILSSPLPYLLLAIFYFIGFASGIFAGNSNGDADDQIETKNIQVESHSDSKTEISATSVFHFNDYQIQKFRIDNSVETASPSAVCKKEKLIYLVHDIKINPSFFPDSNFCRPPPSCS